MQSSLVFCLRCLLHIFIRIKKYRYSNRTSKQLMTENSQILLLSDLNSKCIFYSRFKKFKHLLKKKKKKKKTGYRK